MHRRSHRDNANLAVFAECLERDFFPKDKCRGRLLGARAVGLALLWTINAFESNAFWVVVMQDFNGVAVEDTDDLAGEVTSKERGC